MENNDHSLTCKNCNAGLPSGSQNCPGCGNPVEPVTFSTPNSPAKSLTPQPADPLSEISGVIQRAENEIPWNGVFLAMAFVFLLVTYFNK